MNINGFINIKKQIIISIIILIAALIFARYFLVTRSNAKMENRSESTNYKLLNEKGYPSMFMQTDQSELTFYLKITPDIKSPYPVLFTIFMNGRQIECLWDIDTNYTDLYYTTINPNEDRLIKITVINIPKGLNTLQFGTVQSPNKIDFKEEELFNEQYSLNLTPFTIVRDDIMNWSEKSIFNDYNQPSIINKNMSVGMSGVLCFSKNDLVLDLISNVNEHKEIYYYWQNTDKITRKVRFSLLIDWKQVPWPTGDWFVDVSVSPGDIFCKDLLLSEIVKNETNQLSVVAFIDPDRSFWYFDKNDLKANHYGVLSYATLKNIILINSTYSDKSGS